MRDGLVPGMLRGPVTPTGTVISQVCTILYFLFFLLMPWYTARDATKPVPERVTWK